MSGMSGKGFKILVGARKEVSVCVGQALLVVPLAPLPARTPPRLARPWE